MHSPNQGNQPQRGQAGGRTLSGEEGEDNNGQSWRPAIRNGVKIITIRQKPFVNH